MQDERAGDRIGEDQKRKETKRECEQNRMEKVNFARRNTEFLKRETVENTRNNVGNAYC